MREKESQILTKYEWRLIQVHSKMLLQEIFRFLEKGVPQGLGDDPPEKVSEVQEAIKDILKSTRLSILPDQKSVEVFESYLNLPIRPIPYKSLHLYSKEDGSESGSGKIVAYDFEESTYLRHVAWLLKRCLDECYSAIFLNTFSDDVWLVGVCPECGVLFLKSKANQVCCKRRSCSNSHDYKNRTNTEEGKQKNREKSSRSYYSDGAKLKRTKIKRKART